MTFIIIFDDPNLDGFVKPSEEIMKTWSDLMRDVNEERLATASGIVPTVTGANSRAEEWLVHDIWEQLVGLRPVNGGPRIR